MEQDNINWFKIEVNKFSEGTYTYVGCSSLSLEAVIAKLQAGDYIRLDNLLYWDRGIIKEWSQWDKSVVPTVYINPLAVLDVMQFIRDPRLTEH